MYSGSHPCKKRENYPYDEFPEDLSAEAGMKGIYGKDKMDITCHPDMVYPVKDGMELHLRAMLPTVLNVSRRYPTIFHIQGSALLP